MAGDQVGSTGSTGSSRGAKIEIRAEASAILHGLRGVAALAVCAGHLSVLMFTRPDLHELGGAWPVFQLATGIAHESVVVFLVLSGYFVGGSVVVRARSDKWSWQNYLIDRTTRLYVVLIPALILTFVVDFSGSALFERSPVYHRSTYLAGMYPHPVSDTFTATHFLGSLLGLTP